MRYLTHSWPQSHNHGIPSKNQGTFFFDFQKTAGKALSSLPFFLCAHMDEIPNSYIAFHWWNPIQMTYTSSNDSFAPSLFKTYASGKNLDYLQTLDM